MKAGLSVEDKEERGKLRGRLEKGYRRLEEAYKLWPASKSDS